MWRDIKARIHELTNDQQCLPVWIIDEAQNLPVEFFRDFPAFLNFAFDSKDLMTVWLVGHRSLTITLSRAPYAALASRLHTRVQLQPFCGAGTLSGIDRACPDLRRLHTDVIGWTRGLELLRQASQGLPRQAGRILKTSMQLALSKGLNHLPR